MRLQLLLSAGLLLVDNFAFSDEGQRHIGYKTLENRDLEYRYPDPREYDNDFYSRSSSGSDEEAAYRYEGARDFDGEITRTEGRISPALMFKLYQTKKNLQNRNPDPNLQHKISHLSSQGVTERLSHMEKLLSPGIAKSKAKIAKKRATGRNYEVFEEEPRAHQTRAEGYACRDNIECTGRRSSRGRGHKLHSGAKGRNCHYRRCP